MLKQVSFFAGLSTLVILLNACEHQPIQIGKTNNNNGGNTNDSGNCDPDSVYFVNDIMPIMTAYCTNGANQVNCHNDIKAEDGVKLNNYNNVKNEIGNKGLNSDFFEQINKGKMPYNSSKLPQDIIDKIAKWINQGALNNSCNSGCDTSKFKYTADIAPIISNNCGATSCHGGGNLILTNHAALQTVALNGRLVGALSHTSGFLPMPNAASYISNCQMTKIKNWIKDGAPNN
jgi:hypothetical protein